MSASSKTNYLMPQSNMDTEYNALRRRMSRCRVKEGGKLPVDGKIVNFFVCPSLSSH